MIINAMVFQERLASTHADILPLETTRDRGHVSKVALISAWAAILEIDYWPIFKMARDVVASLSDVEASEVLDECARTAGKLLAMGMSEAEIAELHEAPRGLQCLAGRHA